MKLFGFEIRRAPVVAKAFMQPASNSPWTRIFDTFVGQWQQNVSVDADEIMANSAVFACIRLIAGDVGKLRPRLMRFDTAASIWREAALPQVSPILQKPNSFQTRIKFYEQWLISKLVYGNAYVLKIRGAGGAITALRVIDATRVTPLVSDGGDVFYRLRKDPLGGVESDVTVPAREIIHDLHVALDHPLIGVSPITACAQAAAQGIKIQKNSTRFFANQSRPSFILSAPGAIDDETAARLKRQWEANYGGDNYGRTAVLGDGLKPEPFTISAQDSQLIEQLGWTSEDICRAFGVPAYKIGVGAMPAFNNVEALDQAYYSQTLQEPIECIELLLDEGLELPTGYGIEFDLDGLLRMDSETQTRVIAEQIKNGFLSPNEARQRINLPPVEGGDSPYLQQQNFSLAALAKRDASPNPFAVVTPPSPPTDSARKARDLERLLAARGDRLLSG